MVIVDIRAGLGNQFYQYAFGRRIAHDRGVPLKLDVTWFGGNPDQTPRDFGLAHFRINASVASPAEVRPYRQPGPLRRRVYRLERLVAMHRRACVREVHSHTYDPNMLNVRRNVYLRGFWQCFRYFEPISAFIRAELTVAHEPDDENRALLNQIEQTESISLHIRRGDRLANPTRSLSLDYYRRAAERAADGLSSPHFFCFSDDPDWVRANLRTDFPMTVIAHNGPDRPHEDMRLMSRCRHHIIANSTFSWWGAWLAHRPGQRVIAPWPWFPDRVHSREDKLLAAWDTIDPWAGNEGSHVTV